MIEKSAASHSDRLNQKIIISSVNSVPMRNLLLRLLGSRDDHVNGIKTVAKKLINLEIDVS